MTVTPELLVEYLGLDGITVTEAAAAALLVGFDQAELAAGVRATLTTAVWDREAPINGVPAEEVLAHRDDVADGDVALVLDAAGTVVYFQPHLPGAPGHQPIVAGQGLVVAGQLADAHAARCADQATLTAAGAAARGHA